jgi:hypothetical protein
MTLALDTGLDGGQVLFGGNQQIFAFAAALGSEIGIAGKPPTARQGSPAR